MRNCKLNPKNISEVENVTFLDDEKDVDTKKKQKTKK
jgi:hypothetical protein